MTGSIDALSSVLQNYRRHPCFRAAGEVVIRQALGELDVWEIDSKFTFVEHQASTGEQVPLIKDWKDVLNKVGDNQVLLQSIKGSPYYFSFGDRAIAWETKLNDLDEILNSLNAAQRKWVYLEPYQEQMKLKSPSQTGVWSLYSGAYIK